MRGEDAHESRIKSEDAHVTWTRDQDAHGPFVPGVPVVTNVKPSSVGHAGRAEMKKASGREMSPFEAQLKKAFASGTLGLA